MIKSALTSMCLLSACTINIDGHHVDDRAPTDDASDAALDGAVATVDAGPVTVDAVKYVFVTSTTYTGGSLGGISGADAICAKHAAAAGLSGTYAAWISTTTSSPATRFTRSTAGYQLVDGSTIATSWADLVSGNLRHPIDVDELGLPFSQTQICMSHGGAWTETDFDGTLFYASACSDWTDLHGNGVIGDTSLTNSQWTNSGCAPPCTSLLPLYCFEQ